MDYMEDKLTIKEQIVIVLKDANGKVKDERILKEAQNENKHED